jgi:hypothetical protein
MYGYLPGYSQLNFFLRMIKQPADFGRSGYFLNLAGAGI